MSQRQAVTTAGARAYARADRAKKSVILDELVELVELTGWHRDYARAALRDALKLRVVKPRAPRWPTYGPLVMVALIKCWAVLRAPAGKRLAPMLVVLVPILRRDGELDLTDDEARLLSQMSAATIDRRLAGERAKMMPRGRSHTKPGSLLKSQIPVRTWADWDDAVPGFVEVDLVGHEGGNASGEFCFTLTVTDVATGWTINRSVPNKAQKWVFAAQKTSASRSRFRSWGSIRTTVRSSSTTICCAGAPSRRSPFTRSRAGNKNDGSYVEQKNWARVRELVGYYRYDTPAELAKLNEIWELDAVFANYLPPQQKLIFKQRNGAKVTKKHDTAKTPHQRAATHEGIRKRQIITMNAAFKRLKPAALSRQTLALTGELEILAQAKKAPRPKPPINTAWNQTSSRRKSNEATT